MIHRSVAHVEININNIKSEYMHAITRHFRQLNIEVN